MLLHGGIGEGASLFQPYEVLGQYGFYKKCGIFRDSLSLGYSPDVPKSLPQWKDEGFVSAPFLPGYFNSEGIESKAGMNE